MFPVTVGFLGVPYYYGRRTGVSYLIAPRPALD